MKTEIDTSTTAGKIAVMQAFQDGKKIERLIIADMWLPVTDPLWDWSAFDYRIAKQQNTRHLLASDWDGLPVVWVRSVKEPMSHWLVTGITEKGFMYAGRARSWAVSDTKYLVWSTDRKTWNPFTVEETQ